MRRPGRLPSLAAVIALSTLAAAPAHAGDYNITLPEGGDPNGNFYSFLYIGPGQGTITDATLNITFTTLGNYDAGMLDIQLLAPVIADDGFPGVLWEFSGSDLGWSGQGTFSAIIDIPELEGVLGAPNPTAIWVLDVGTFENKPPLFFGTFTDTFFHFEIDPVPAPGALALLASGALAARRRRRIS